MQKMNELQTLQMKLEQELQKVDAEIREAVQRTSNVDDSCRATSPEFSQVQRDAFQSVSTNFDRSSVLDVQPSDSKVGCILYSSLTDDQMVSTDWRVKKHFSCI